MGKPDTQNAQVTLQSSEDITCYGTKEGGRQGVSLGAGDRTSKDGSQEKPHWKVMCKHRAEEVRKESRGCRGERHAGRGNGRCKDPGVDGV